MTRRILIAAPRGWCAGVDRAVEIVERALERFGAPVYVRKQIVHNLHVVHELEAKGAIFVESTDEVPEGAVCVFSAHGVSPAVRAGAAERHLQVIDATCPLVTKVHVEAKRFAKAGRTIFLIGHAGHEEVEGTAGEAPGNVVLVERPEDIAKVVVEDPDNVAYVTQTTLAVDDTAEMIETLRKRFPAMAAPRHDDICYATQNRQVAVKALAARSDHVLIVGAENSSNSRRLVEVSIEAGTPAHLVCDESAIDASWLEDAEVIGVSSGASTPEVLVDRVLKRLARCGYEDVEEVRTATEDVTFSLPAGLLQLTGNH